MLPLPPDEPLIEPLEPLAPDAVLPVLLPPVLGAVLPVEPLDEPPLPDVELPPIELLEAPELSSLPWTCTL